MTPFILKLFVRDFQSLVGVRGIDEIGCTEKRGIAVVSYISIDELIGFIRNGIIAKVA
jgi:hypothetical protein